MNPDRLDMARRRARDVEELVRRLASGGGDASTATEALRKASLLTETGQGLMLAVALANVAQAIQDSEKAQDLFLRRVQPYVLNYLHDQSMLHASVKERLAELIRLRSDLDNRTPAPVDQSDDDETL